MVESAISSGELGQNPLEQVILAVQIYALLDAAAGG